MLRVIRPTTPTAMQWMGKDISFSVNMIFTGKLYLNTETVSVAR